MAELNIKITTKYDQAQQGFENVKKSVKSYRQELVEAKTEGRNLDAAMESYTTALNKSLQSTDYMKDGMAALKEQSKLLKEQIFELNSAFGSDDKLVKQLKTALDDVNAEMATLQKTSKQAARSGMGELEKSSGGAGLKLLSVAKNILKFQLLMGPITSAVRGFRNTISDSVKVAAEAEQVFNKLSTVFTGLESSAKSAASAIASQLGVATSTAAGALSTVGDLLQAQGMGTSTSLSTASSWVSKFQDIIAFKDINMSLDEFAQTFMSGAAGNLRNFRTFGSIVKESAVNARLASQGLDKLTGSELELAKMTTRATLALEQQENAMGATEREWDSMLSVNRRLNEAWKEYKENLGESINETFKPTKIWLTTILDYANDVTRAIKEINGGEFTIKVRQDGSVVEDSLIMKALDAAVLNPRLKHGGVDRTSAEVVSNAMKKNARSTSGATMLTYSADELAAVMKATGATSSEMKEAIQTARENGKNIAEIDDATWAAANAAVQAYWDLQEAVTDAKNAILSSAENFDSFTESLASLAHVSVRSTNLAAIGEGVNEYNYEDLMQSFGLTASGQTNAVLKSVLNQFSGFSVDTFIPAIDKAFGREDKGSAFKAWLDEIEALYTILYNRQVQFGDVGEDTLEGVANEWKRVNDMLQKYNDSLKKTEVTLRDVTVSTTWQTQLANFGLSNEQIARNQLVAQRDEAAGRHDPIWVAYQKEIDALNKFVKATEEATKAAAELAAWKETGNRAINATGIAGQIYQAFQGDGDIWSKIINAVLAILENTESWPKIAEMLNQIFDMFEPVVDQMLDLLVSASPAFEIIIFCLKVIASAIVFIQTIINQIQTIIKGVWENIKIFFSNFGKVMTGRYNGGWFDFNGELNRVTEEGVEYLKRIWDSTSTIEKEVGDDNLKVLRDLYARNIINEDQFNAGARVLQSHMNFDPVAATSPNYITASQGSSSSVSYGGVTIQFNGSNTEEMKRWITDFFSENGMSYNVAIGG